MKTVGRNDPCPCNSGRKFKHCCYAKDRAQAGQQRVGRAREAAAAREALQQAVQFHRAGQLPEAEACYQRVLQLDSQLSAPDQAGVHYNLGNVLKEQSRPEEAVDSYRSALEIQPHSVEIAGNLGGALSNLGRLDEAAIVYRGALAIRPGDAILHFNLGNVLSEQGKLDEAAGSYRKALELKPDWADVHLNLGNALRDLGRPGEALASYRRSLEIQPELGLALALADQGKPGETLAVFRAALAAKPASAGAYSELVAVAGYRALLPPAEYFALARGWERAVIPEAARDAARRQVFRAAPLAGRRLKLGYVSGDFRHHAVSYFIEQVFRHHDPGRVELFAYSTHRKIDSTTAEIRSHARHWAQVAEMSDAAIRERVAADGIDVLVDLSGHTVHNRLGVFARRAAPVQAHYLGYYASTGLTEMDYWIGDDVITPPEADDQFCERVWRLPRVWCSYKTVADAPEPNWRPAGDGSVWLVSCNNLGKLNAETLALWAKVLHALPEGRLRLKTKELLDIGNRRRILDAMASHGIAPDRIDLQRESNWSSYMAQYNSADIALDPVISHGGGTITCDALWMGVPVIHALGSCTGARYSASMLSAIGHPEWIARSDEEYVEKAVALARDADRRRELRRALRGEMARSPLCDARDLARKLEDAYIGMFERWRERASLPH